MAGKKKRTVSILDVAKEAGVSTATVSRVFNKRDTVRPETLKYVLEVAERIGFKLSDGRPGPKPKISEPRPIIRFIHFLDIETDGTEINQTLVLIKRGAELAAEKAGYRLVYNIHGSEEDLSWGTDEGETMGVILLGCRPSKKTEALLKKTPCCWVMTGIYSPPWGDQVMPDQREVGRLAARYLVERGHKRLVLLRLGTRDRVHRFREEGFAYELESTPDVKWIEVKSEASSGSNLLLAREDLLDELVENLKGCELRPTACFIDTDRTLLSLYSRLVKAGIVPGKDIEMVSCNNMEVYRRQLPCEYESIDVHFELIGRMGVGQLIWRIKNPNTSCRVRSLVLPEILQ